MTRRLTSPALLLLALAALAGCGSTGATPSTPDAGPRTVTDAPAGMTLPAGSSSNTGADVAVASSTGNASATAHGAVADLAQLGAPFAADSPWNTSVADAAIAPNSSTLMARAEERYGVVVQGNRLEDIVTKREKTTKPLFINTDAWTDPIVFTSTGSPVKLECRQINLPPPHNDCGDGWEISSLPIPASGFPRPSYDGWLTVLDESTGYAYDFWRARFTSDNTVLSYQFVRRWSLNGSGYLAPGQVSARGSGLPLFAGEILPRDILSGHIDHALAISVPGPAATYYVQPASATDGNGATDSLPEGARIKLEPSFDIAAALKRLPGRTNLNAARAIYTALKTYGAIVVDRSAVPTLYAVPNYDWNQVLRSPTGVLVGPNGQTPLPDDLQNPSTDGTPLLSGNVAAALHLSDFEVVQLPQLQQYPPLPGTTAQGGVDSSAPQPVVGQNADETPAPTASGSGATPTVPTSGGLLP